MRVPRSHLVLHALRGDSADSPKVGFSVSKAVGNSVTRHAVSRRLRHVMRDHLGELPAGSRLVVRALPSAATASSAELDAQVSDALSAWSSR
jgi:ribonuclease P protein component